jgi:hypothetical protein
MTEPLQRTATSHPWFPHVPPPLERSRVQEGFRSRRLAGRSHRFCRGKPPAGQARLRRRLEALNQNGHPASCSPVTKA